MKSIYIPKGETRSYEFLFTDNLVVHGQLNVASGIQAKHISGHGVIHAGTIGADTIVADEVEASAIICQKLAAKRVTAPEVYASDSAVVTCYLAATYVETGKLTVALSEIDEVKAQEVINLAPRKRGMLRTLFASFLRSLWIKLTAPNKAVDADYQVVEDKSEEPRDIDAETAEQVADTVREVLDGEDSAEVDPSDFELKRIIAMFKLARSEGYTLQLIPGTPEENAPGFDAESGTIVFPPAA